MNRTINYIHIVHFSLIGVNYRIIKFSKEFQLIKNNILFQTLILKKYKKEALKFKIMTTSNKTSSQTILNFEINVAQIYIYIFFFFFAEGQLFATRKVLKRLKHFISSTVWVSVWSPGRWWRTFHLRVSSVKTFSPAYRCVWVFFFTSYRRLTTMWDCGSNRWSQSLTVWEIITFIDHKKRQRWSARTDFLFKKP